MVRGSFSGRGTVANRPMTSVYWRLLALAFVVSCGGRRHGPGGGNVLVYGATSAGIAAAVAASRNGAAVVLLDAGVPLGAMSSQGLGAADIGNAASIGGISAEFFRRVGDKYGRSVA